MGRLNRYENPARLKIPLHWWAAAFRAKRQQEKLIRNWAVQQMRRAHKGPPTA